MATATSTKKTPNSRSTSKVENCVYCRNYQDFEITALKLTEGMLDRKEMGKAKLCPFCGAKLAK